MIVKQFKFTMTIRQIFIVIGVSVVSLTSLYILGFISGASLFKASITLPEQHMAISNEVERNKPISIISSDSDKSSIELEVTEPNFEDLKMTELISKTDNLKSDDSLLFDEDMQSEDNVTTVEEDVNLYSRQTESGTNLIFDENKQFDQKFSIDEMYTVQIGSFSFEENARKVEQALLGKNYKVKTIRVLNPIDASFAYKVIFGIYPSKSTAKIAAIEYGETEHQPAIAKPIAWIIENELPKAQFQLSSL